MKLGELMVRQGLLTEAQVAEVLAVQAHRTEPFGSICERLVGILPEVVEGAWVEQYSVLTEGITPDFSRQDPSVLNVITTRQAWQFRIVPVCWDEGSLVLTTTNKQMARALRFATKVIPFPVYFLLIQPEAMAEALNHSYPMPGLDAAVVLEELEMLSSNLSARGIGDAD